MKKIYLNSATISKNLLALGLLAATVSLSSCSGNGEPKLKDSTEETIQESTKGIITELEEVAPGDDYKILDEKIIEDKTKSIAIVHRLDGKIDTVRMDKLRKDDQYSRSHSGLTNVLLFGLAASYFNRNLRNTSPNSSYYKNADAYNKSAGLKNNLTSTASSRKVRVPGKSSSGYGGSGRSFRSYGG